jgi:hypothetical protein
MNPLNKVIKNKEVSKSFAELKLASNNISNNDS